MIDYHSLEKKIKIIDEDALDLLNFYNAMIRVKSLVKVPTLEDTMDLCSIMLEGNVYINGKGRSLQTECRQVMTREICGIKKIKITKKRGLVDTSITDQSNDFDFFDLSFEMTLYLDSLKEMDHEGNHPKSQQKRENLLYYFF